LKFGDNKLTRLVIGETIRSEANNLPANERPEFIRQELQDTLPGSWVKVGAGAYREVPANSTITSVKNYDPQAKIADISFEINT
jgi:hypothetical protein